MTTPTPTPSTLGAPTLGAPLPATAAASTNTQAKAMVEITGLTKRYRDLVAVRDLNLKIDAGEVFGFIGPNGAGKTTTIKTLATLLEPTSGTVFVDGIDVLRHPLEVRRIIGYMPDFFGVYDDVKVWEYLDFFAAGV
jgi:ABC-2 type transport system ATP-binding protein